MRKNGRVMIRLFTLNRFAPETLAMDERDDEHVT